MRTAPAAVLALVLAAPAPALAAHSLTAPPNGSSSCTTIAAAGGGVVDDPADLILTPVLDELDVTLNATASGGVNLPLLYMGTLDYACALMGAGTVGYGAIHGTLNLTTSSTPAQLLPTPVNEPNILQNDGRATGQGLLSMQFDDTGVVVSTTLAPGTPVTLQLVLSVESMEIPLPPARADTGVTYHVEAADKTAVPGDTVDAILLGNEIVTRPLDTFVGNTIDLRGRLDLSVSALAGRVQAGEEYIGQATATVDAGNTATFGLEVPEGVGFESESGHDYTAAPEAAQPLGLAAGALLLARERRRRSRRAAAGVASVLHAGAGSA